MSAAQSSSSPYSKLCYNTACKELKPDNPRKGWRLRAGEFAELCDRCGSIFEEGRFCETFHANLTGWRNCESCGKQIHCGCIVSCHLFTLLDPGGIECFTCERKNMILTSNPAWTWGSSAFSHSPLPDRLKDFPVKAWSQLAGSGPVPWLQAPSLFSSIPSTELPSRAPYEVDFSAAINKFSAGERISLSPLDKKKIDDFSETLQNGSLKLGARETLENGAAGKNCVEQKNSCLSVSQQSSSIKEVSSTSQIGLTIPYASSHETSGQVGAAGINLRPTLQPLGKPFISNLHNGVDASSETQIRNARPRAEVRGRNQLLPRYWPRFIDEELHQISLDSNSVITPLFEKTLSASDAGRIGRLVLPKKCAEAYFPPISQPEGLPLKVQDAKGKEWIFQFRFWPNNNSRMYVLEGVTPCIQSMHLQAGDTVTFSRLDPEGKLVMGFRKASTATPSDQDLSSGKTIDSARESEGLYYFETTNEFETNKTGSGSSAYLEAELADPISWSKVDKSGYIAKEAVGAKTLISRKSKCSTLGFKSKRLRIENEDMMELKLTWEEAQGLLRPSPDHVPSVMVIEGFEFEEYEDAPILGKPTIFATDNVGEKIQWVQCENCFKFRKLPADALLPFKWICSDNTWDPDRSSCSAAQELTSEELEDLLPQCVSVASKKKEVVEQDSENVEALECLDTLANLAILDEGESLPSSAQATTKHPRHRPGCSCIVCIQPPSGKGPKHKQTCTCIVCLTVKRRFRTLMMRREKKQSEKETETTCEKPHHQLSLPEKLDDDDDTITSSITGNCSNQIRDGLDDDVKRIKSSTSPFKGQIDLNIQPEREEELSPGSDSRSVMKLLHDATERCLKQQRLSSSCGGDNSSGNQPNTQQDGGDIVAEKLNSFPIGGNHHNADSDTPAPLSIKALPSTTAT